MTTLSESDLRNFCGDLKRYRHFPNRRLIDTPGIRHSAAAGNGYWIIDAIASWIGSKQFNEAIAKDHRMGEMHFWALSRLEDRRAKLLAKADPFIVQNIDYTDSTSSQNRRMGGIRW